MTDQAPALPQIRTVLCTLDFSPISADVLSMAAEVAEAYEAQLIALHVVEVWDARYDFIMADLAKRIETDAREKLRAELERLGKDHAVSVEVIIEKGAAPYKILQTIRQRRPELVVLGSHGRRGLDRVLLGSVSDKVLHTSPASVLIVRPPKHPDIKTIVCAVDFSAASQAAVQRAVELAQAEKISIVKVVNAFEVPLGFMEAGMTYESAASKIQNVHRQGMDDFLKSVGTSNVALEPVWLEGPPAAAVQRYAQQVGADLVVVGSHGHSALASFLLGGTSYRIVHEAQVSVWAVKAPGQRESLWAALDRL